MTCKLTIYRDNKVVNTFEYSDAQAKDELVKIFLNKVDGIGGYRVVRGAYGKTIRITQKFPNDPTNSNLKYCYEFVR